MSQRNRDLAEENQGKGMRLAGPGRAATKTSSAPRLGIWLLSIVTALIVGATAYGLSLLPALDAVGIVRDVLVLVYLFTLRLGVPLIITLMFGSFLQHWLSQQDAKEMIGQQQFETTAPCCWETKNCPEAVRENCAAHQHPELPCWLALQVAGYGLKEQCYACPLYTTRRVTVPA